MSIHTLRRFTMINSTACAPTTQTMIIFELQMDYLCTLKFMFIYGLRAFDFHCTFLSLYKNLLAEQPKQFCRIFCTDWMFVLYFFSDQAMFFRRQVRTHLFADEGRYRNTWIFEAHVSDYGVGVRNAHDIGLVEGIVLSEQQN